MNVEILRGVDLKKSDWLDEIISNRLVLQTYGEVVSPYAEARHVK